VTDNRVPPTIQWHDKLAAGFRRTAERLGGNLDSLFNKEKLDRRTLDEIEEALIASDLGPVTAMRIRDRLEDERYDKGLDEAGVRQVVADEVAKVLRPVARPLEIEAFPRPQVILVIGVNGSGKTTTLGKIAADLTEKGARVLIAAGDTFRAAAVEQLKVWADRAGADFMSKPTGSDAAALAYEAVERAKAEHYDVVLIDTAGRLQNKQGLMDELLKVIRVVKKVDPDYPHETLLVLDATVGRNALAQEKIFGNQVGVSGIVMTKLDGTARGGVLVPVARASDSPIKLIGVGEGVDDLQPFDARAFSRSLVGLKD
jgi:fused signal recognition particle receptor